MEQKIMRRPRTDRKYLGIVVTPSNYREIVSTQGEDKVKFHKKHLKAYLAGKDWFYHGWTKPEDPTQDPKPIRHYVEQAYETIERVRRIAERPENGWTALKSKNS